MKQREIKFRAFDDGKMFYSKDMETSFDGDGPYNVLRQFFDFIREDAVVMQFTGLLDKNRTPIYEGDVVSTNIDDPDKIYLRTIVWDTGAFMVKQIHGSANYWLWSHKFETCPINLVVVGNIYQNANLLK